jgi:hypothetical protein
MGALHRTITWRDDPGRLYMAMTGYFDESGTHGAESPCVIVGGFLASVGQWDAYEGDLGALFTDYGVKKFHAKDFRGRKGDFKGWPHAKRASFNTRFLMLADKHLAYGVSTVLPSADYHRIYRAGDVVRTARRDTQYGLCTRVALWKTITLLADRKDDWPINFVFEAGTNHEMDALRVFLEEKEQLLPQYREMFGSMTFETKQALPLAMADSLAYAIFRLSAGYSVSPEPNVAIVGPTDRPYRVSLPMTRTMVDENTLARLRNELSFR